MRSSALIALFLCSAFTAIAAEAPGEQVTPADQAEYDRIRTRFRGANGKPLVLAAGWAVAHAADDDEAAKADTVFTRLQAFEKEGQVPRELRAGGIDAFKKEAATLLESSDPVVRGFGAVVLGVVGDAAYAERVASLLKERKGAPKDVIDAALWHFDRGRAAMALGLMGAKAHAPALVAMLQSRYENDRSGAAMGLGFMGMKQHSRRIAALLEDERDSVVVAALQALGELGAAEHTASIAKCVDHPGDPAIADTARAVLARLKGDKQGGKSDDQPGELSDKEELLREIERLRKKAETLRRQEEALKEKLEAVQDKDK